MFRVTLLVCIVAVVFSAKQISFKDCGSKGAKISAIYADQCIHEPCSLHRGEAYTGRVEFTASKASTSAHAILHGGLGLLSVPWPVKPADACQGSLPCPLEAGKNYTYPINMECPIIAPSARLTAKWEIRDENNENILCFILPLVIH